MQRKRYKKRKKKYEKYRIEIKENKKKKDFFQRMTDSHETPVLGTQKNSFRIFNKFRLTAIARQYHLFPFRTQK